MIVDTLSIARDLKAAEPPPEQAEAIAAAIGRSVIEGSATKADLALTRQELKGDTGQLRSEPKASTEQRRAKIERSRDQMLIWVGGFVFTAVGVLIAVIKL